MAIYQLDGECNIKEFIKDIEKSLEEEKSIQKTKQLEKNSQNHKINSILSTQIYRKWCYFYTLLTFSGRLFLCPKRADDVIKASMEYAVDRL